MSLGPSYRKELYGRVFDSQSQRQASLGGCFSALPLVLVLVSMFMFVFVIMVLRSMDVRVLRRAFFAVVLTACLSLGLKLLADPHS